MSTLLYLEVSPTKLRSKSIAVAKEFLAAYRDANPEDAIDTWDLWNTTLPEFDGHIIDAKYKILQGKPHSAEEALAWEEVVRIFDRFSAADKYLLGVPMWNFGIPYKLKHFIDVITQPGLAFRFSPESGYHGLVTGKPAVVIYARGGDYSSEQMQVLDFQKRYVETLLGFIGFTDIRSVIAEPTAGGPEQVAEVEEMAKAKAREMGTEF